jgi:hypothetical protein
VLVDAATPIERLAANVVRGYLEALIRGDEQTAHAALAGEAGNGNGPLAEEAFIDRNSHIKSIHAQETGDASARVETEIVGGKGLYYVTFQVERSERGALIADHDFIKP